MCPFTTFVLANPHKIKVCEIDKIYFTTALLLINYFELLVRGRFSFIFCSASAPLCLTTQRGAAVLLKHLKGRRSDSQFNYLCFLSTSAAAASTSTAGAMLITGAPVWGFCSPLAAAFAVILITPEPEALPVLSPTAVPGLVLAIIIS